MTLTIGNISPETERLLKAVAARAGVDESEYARQLIEQGLLRAAKTEPLADQATVDLLARWDIEDATTDPAELARRQREWEAFRKAMNEDSLSNRVVYPPPNYGQMHSNVAFQPLIRRNSMVMSFLRRRC